MKLILAYMTHDTWNIVLPWKKLRCSSQSTEQGADKLFLFLITFHVYIEWKPGYIPWLFLSFLTKAILTPDTQQQNKTKISGRLFFPTFHVYGTNDFFCLLALSIIFTMIIMLCLRKFLPFWEVEVGVDENLKMDSKWKHGLNKTSTGNPQCS